MQVRIIGTKQQLEDIGSELTIGEVYEVEHEIPEELLGERGYKLVAPDHLGPFLPADLVEVVECGDTPEQQEEEKKEPELLPTGTLVKIICSQNELNLINADDLVAGGIYTIMGIDSTDKTYRLSGDGYYVYPYMVEPVEPEVTKVHHNTGKTWTRRQFSRSYKLGIVQAINFGPRGTRAKLIKEQGISGQLVSYWQKQFKAGHFDTDRAIAFSRKKEIIR